MKNKTFEYFFSQDDKEIFSIEKIINNKNIREKYSNDMFCPECFEAKLTFVEKTSSRKAHLRRMPTFSHNKKCSYNFEYAKKDTILSYFNSLNENQTKDKLHSIMRMLCKSKIENTSSKQEQYSDIDISPMLIKQNKKTEYSKSLRRKHINKFINKDEEGEIFAFYGKAQLKTLKKNEYYLLEIWTNNRQNGMKFNKRIYRGGIKDLVDENIVYNIVLIEEIKFKNNYPRVDLINRNAILYQIAKDDIPKKLDYEKHIFMLVI